jgi:hypothetical protein
MEMEMIMSESDESGNKCVGQNVREGNMQAGAAEAGAVSQRVETAEQQGRKETKMWEEAMR